jgi:hypothetical protein
MLKYKAKHTTLCDLDYIKIVEHKDNKDIDLSSSDFLHRNIDEAIMFFEDILKDLRYQKEWEENERKILDEKYL